MKILLLTYSLLFIFASDFLYSQKSIENKLFLNKRAFKSKYKTKVSTTSKININTASKKELMTLISIGPRTADKIIFFRNNKSLFYYTEDIMRVSGIGTGKYNKIKHSITVGSVKKQNRFASIINWTMKEFNDIGFSPALSLKCVLFIQKKSLFNELNDLLKLKEMDHRKLNLIKEKLNSYKENNILISGKKDG